MNLINNESLAEYKKLLNFATVESKYIKNELNSKFLSSKKKNDLFYKLYICNNNIKKYKFFVEFYKRRNNEDS